MQETIEEELNLSRNERKRGKRERVTRKLRKKVKIFYQSYNVGRQEEN